MNQPETKPSERNFGGIQWIAEGYPLSKIREKAEEIFSKRVTAVCKLINDARQTDLFQDALDEDGHCRNVLRTALRKMKSTGLIFSSSMVKALLAGTKTQTRRVIRNVPDDTIEILPVPDKRWRPYDRQFLSTGHGFRCPYGVAGDQIWVRETWQNDPAGKWGTCYRASGHNQLCKFHGHLWRPSIFMPRWASRITLELTRVRVEKLQSISEEDAVAEGCVGGMGQATIKSERFGCCMPGAVYQYAVLWDSLHGEGNWAENPWVWVLEFRKL
jgi:hypothetical protein